MKILRAQIPEPAQVNIARELAPGASHRARCQLPQAQLPADRARKAGVAPGCKVEAAGAADK